MARMSDEKIREKLESCVGEILGSENRYEIHSCSLYIEGISAGCAILYKQEDGSFQAIKIGDKELCHVHYIEFDTSGWNEWTAFGTFRLDYSKIENLDKIKEIIKDVNGEIISLDTKKFEAKIKKQKTQQTFSNLASLYQCFEIGKEIGEDLIFFIEDDYLHFETMLEEMIATYERVSSQVGKDIFMCPADYPYLYMNNEKTNILIGNKRHWRTINKTLCTFLTSGKMVNKHFDKLLSMCKKEHSPFEKPLHEIFKSEVCLSPIPSLAIHATNINSIYGVSPVVNIKKLWDESNYD